MVCLCVVGPLFVRGCCNKVAVRAATCTKVMVQNAEERKNILNYINFTKGKVVNVSVLLDS